MKLFYDLQSKLWVLRFISIPVGLFILSIIFLMMIDTYSILDTNRKTFYDEPNRNFLKVEYILNHPNDYNGFIFGSSRVGSMLPNHFHGANFYNMTHSEGIPHEHLINLKLFLHHGIKIKKVFLGLDEFSYQVSFAQHQQRFLTKAHPLASNTSWTRFYAFYFFRFPTKHDKSIAKKRWIEHTLTTPMDIDHQSDFYEHFLSSLKPNNPNDPIYQKPTHYDGDYIQETLLDIREIVKLCQRHKIDLVVFMNPIHHTTFQDTNKQRLLAFKKQLASITAFYDFTGPNAVTKNNLNFLDTSHYTLDVGTNMVKIMESKNKHYLYTDKSLLDNKKSI